MFWASSRMIRSHWTVHMCSSSRCAREYVVKTTSYCKALWAKDSVILSCPWWTMTVKEGANRSISLYQFPKTDMGQIIKVGPGLVVVRSCNNNAMTCMVLPSPMSSAKHPPSPSWLKKWSQDNPLTWYGRSVPTKVPGGSTGDIVLESNLSRIGLRVPSPSMPTTGNPTSDWFWDNPRRSASPKDISSSRVFLKKVIAFSMS